MKTPKREHRCVWCGGPLDVHLDPSHETEETSICRDCHRRTISHCGHTWEPYKERARWMRKNREARLKNKIRKLSQAIEDAARTEDFWRNYYKHFQNDRLLKRSILIKECGTYGHNIEGS